MRFRIRFADQIVGVCILLAILGIAATLILLGLNQRWFARNYLFWSRFASAEGMSAGMPINLKGFEIGKVDKIKLTGDNLVDIEFHVFDNYYDKVLPNSVLELSTSPLGLGAVMVFHPGRTEGPPLPEFSFIPSTDLEEGRKLMAKELAQAPKKEDPISAILSQVEPVLREIDATMLSIHSLVDALNNDLRGTGGGPLASTLNDIAAASRRINQMVDRIEKISANLEQMSAGLTDTRGLAKKLLDPKGSFATLLDDNNALYNQIEQSVRELNVIITQLRDFARFVNTTQPQIIGILEKGKTALDQGRDVLEAVKNNPLLRGGVPQKREQQTTFQSYRDEDF